MLVNSLCDTVEHTCSTLIKGPGTTYGGSEEGDIVATLCDTVSFLKKDRPSDKHPKIQRANGP